ncbi:hypothetical protein [Luteolibacter soli]|uniref:Uncharacterized protein n=1 Tax=Luteolibacter soli TaxID=3135280 RepID=A0ABU9AXG8_9BACT
MNEAKKRMVRPVWRWKSFGLGVFVGCFFAWAWWDSMRSETWVQRMDAKGAYGIARVDGVTFVFGGATKFLAWNGVMRLPGKRPAKEVEEMEFESWGSSYVKIADWMVWGCFAVVWGGWMGWRWRRRVC